MGPVVLQGAVTNLSNTTNARLAPTGEAVRESTSTAVVTCTGDGVQAQVYFQQVPADLVDALALGAPFTLTLAPQPAPAADPAPAPPSA